MALVDPKIAMSFRTPETPNMLGQYAQIAQIQSGQQAQQLNALKMQELQQGIQETNAMRGLDLKDPDYRAKVYGISPARGQAFDVAQTEAASKKATMGKMEVETAAAKQKLMSQGLRDISSRPDNEQITTYLRDVQESPLFSPAEKLKADQTAAMLLSMPFEERKAYLASQGASASELKPVAVGSSLMTPQGQLIATAPRQSQLLTPQEEAQKTRVAAAGRAPAQPAAPTITSIVDPVNPNQMITIDARRYQGGGAGSPGVIGVAGKEPGAALRQNKTEAGKSQLADDLENLRAAYTALDEMRAIPSTERNVVSNLMSATAATGVGQALSRAGGSPEQVERDVINSARMRLINSIKNATGMSAQQLNSNVELQTMLKSISDPGQSVQAALRIIGDIEDAYVKGDGKMLKRGGAAAAPAAAANVVVTPDGQSHSFPTPAAAAQFKKAAGL